MSDQNQNEALPTPSTKLEALVQAADQTAMRAVATTVGQPVPTPWAPGQELEIMGRGGLYDLERRRVQVAGDAYYNQVMRTATLKVTGNYTEEVGGNLGVSIGPQPTPEGQEPPADPPLATGNETLTVHGNAKVEFHERKTMISGVINKVWTGPITRMVGMEGVIVGGAYAAVQAAAAMHVSAVSSGDIYGGAARAAANRTYIAGIGYRSVDTSAWAIGAYVRATTFTIEPELDTPSKTIPWRQATMAAKALKLGMAVCPFLDIAVGLIMLPVAIYGLIAAAIGFLLGRKPKPQTPKGPLRTRVQTIGVHKVIAGTDLTQ